MKKAAALCLALGFWLLCGCAGPFLRDRTVVLPTPTPASDPEEAADANFRVSRISPFSFQSGVLDGDGWLTPFAMEGGRLYIALGAPRDGVRLQRVEPRSGFYEEAADLGEIDYNDLRLSPDGRYLLYDEVDFGGDGGGKSLRLTLYDVEAGQGRVVLDLPWLSDDYCLDYAFSGDGTKYFIWLVRNENARLWEKLIEFQGGISGANWLEEMAALPLNEVLWGKCAGGGPETYYVIEEMEKTAEYAGRIYGGDFTAYHKEVHISPDGGRAVVAYDSPEYGPTAMVLEDGALDEEASTALSLQLQMGGEVLQVTEAAVLAVSYEGGSFAPFLLRAGGETVVWEEMREQGDLLDLHLTPDGAHALAVRYGESGGCVVELYPLTAAGELRAEAARTLYQSLQDYGGLLVEPGQERLAVLTRAGQVAYAGNEAYAGEGASGFLDSDAAFTLTVLEME